MFTDKPLLLFLIYGAIAIVLIAMSAGIGHLISSRAKNNIAQTLHNAIDGLDLTEHTFYKQLYAAGNIGDRSVVIRLVPQDRIIPKPTTGKGNLDLLVTVKLKNTYGRKLYLVVEKNSKTISRELSGWEQIKPHFFLNHFPKHSIEDGRADFALLSKNSQRTLLDLSQQYGAITISPDWLSIYIGEENSKQLWGSTSDTPAQLELTFRLPISENPEAIIDAIKYIEKMVPSIEKDLAISTS